MIERFWDIAEFNAKGIENYESYERNDGGKNAFSVLNSAMQYGKMRFSSIWIVKLIRKPKMLLLGSDIYKWVKIGSTPLKYLPTKFQSGCNKLFFILIIFCFIIIK